jgi:CRP-like cAMP-binding protein
VHLGARDAQFIQKVIKELHVTDHVLKMAKATLFSKNGSETSGVLLIFSTEIIFYGSNRLGLRRRNVRLFFKDVLDVAAFGEKLSLFVASDQLKEQSAWLVENRTKSAGSQNEIEKNLPASRQQKPGIFGLSPKKPVVGFTKSFKERCKDISAVATVATHSPQDQINLCLHFSLSDSSMCSEVKTIISGRISEIQKSSLNFQKEAYCASPEMKSDELMFGYLLPGEDADEDEREAVKQIFMQAKTCSYKAGDEILRRGCMDRRLYHIVKGTTACVSQAGQVLVRLGAGEIFGEISFVDSGDSGAGANVIAEDNVECLVLSHETMEMLVALQPLVGARFWRSLAVATAFRMRQQCHALEARRLAEGEGALQRSLT